VSEEKKEEFHPVVELFLRRCASNPEEIAEGKWSWVLDNIQQYGSEAEKAAVQPISNKIILDMVHKNFMRELLNPEQLDLFIGKGPLKYDKATRTSKRTILHQPAGKP
jgi:hypothetical protein